MLKIISIGDVTDVQFENIQKINVLVSDSIKDELKKLFERPNVKVMFNMEGISFLDSTGFAAFLSALRLAQKNQGRFVFYNVSDMVLELFQILHLHTVFKILNSQEEAIKSFE